MRLVDMGVLLWYSFGYCACVLLVWLVYAMFCVLHTSVVGFVVKVGTELHREVRGSKAILACEGLLWRGASIGAREVRRQGEWGSSRSSLIR